ncbi:PspC domain-containing protein [Shewanella frigidimarina]|uniref:PspC domain-containing protein n=1 Tax=Shewanella frigidimarina TaxID=56812 RepID=UPI000F4DCA0F|nr:PspC domain-containing protein [Shewanella frigidimarina]RPA33806.1 PspC domain-containing protein [Shewanella frigidimarina]
MNRLINRLQDETRIVCGVSAKLAKQYGWSLLWTRIVTVGLVLTNPSISLLVYFVIAVVMSQKISRF